MMRYVLLLSVLASAPGPKRDVQIHGFIDDSTYKLVHKQATSPGISELDVYIDSPGGRLDAADDIIGDINVLRAAGVKVRCVVLNKAMSAAAMILETCSERVARPGSEIMFHEPTAMVSGQMTIRGAKSLAQSLIESLDDMIKIVAPRAGLTPAQFGAMIDGTELRLSAEDALRLHFIDSVSAF